MIKFFRKSRQNMINKNRIGKYLLYAIGEIVLVVIGILIALQINNWNEKQKDIAQEQLILEQLKSEYQNNLTQLEEKILMRNEGLEASYSLLNQIDNTNINEEELYKSLWQLLRDPTFDPIKNDIVGSEKLRLIKNDTLVRALSNWSSEVLQVQEWEIEFKKLRTEILVPCYNRLGISRNVTNALWKDGYTPIEALDQKKNTKISIKPTKKDLDLSKVIEDVELEGVISQAITFHQVTNIQSKTLRERIIHMLEIIEREIK
jgi:hypothetical protein